MHANAPYATVNESAPDLLRARRDAHQSSMAIIADGQAAGLIRPANPMEIALLLWSGMHGLAVLLTEGSLAAMIDQWRGQGRKIGSDQHLKGSLPRSAPEPRSKPRRSRDQWNAT